MEINMIYKNKITIGVLAILMCFTVTTYADEVIQLTQNENTVKAEESTNNSNSGTDLNSSVISKYIPKNYKIVASAEDNTGLYYDITAFESSGKYNFVLPYGCDIANTYTTIYGEDGSVMFSGSVDYSGNDYKCIKTSDDRSVYVSAFNSELPLIYLDIDEEYGTISEMNKSENHTVACYGNLTLDVPENIAEKLGCERYLSSAENDSKPEQPGTVRLRGRGNSTWTTVTDKQRPYQIKLEKGLDLLGMGKNKEWAILRTETPLKYLRNKICYDMAKDFGIKYTPGAEFVDVFLNGEYIGMYTLSKPVDIDKNGIPITNIDDEIKLAGNADNIDITGGYLLEIDNFGNDMQFLAQDNMITIKSPENLDTNVEEGSRYDYIKNLMTDMVNAVYGDGYLSDGRHFTEVLDMDSAVRYFIHQELIGNYDSCQGSTFFYKDTDSIDSKIYLGPVWDCEFAFELYDSEWCLPYRKRYWEPHQPLFVAALCRHKEFIDYVLAYYFDNMNDNNIRETYLKYADKISEYEESLGDSAKASSLLYNIDAPSNQYISQYIKSKYSFFEKNLRSLSNDASKGVNLELFEKKTDDESGFDNIYRRNNNIYYSYNNTSEVEKVILLLAYDEQDKLVKVEKTTADPKSRTYGKTVMEENIKISRINAYDGDLSVFVNKSNSFASSESNRNDNYVNGKPTLEDLLKHAQENNSSGDVFLHSVDN
ncbi:MAG: CotH kinase family protein [Clostridia bacterium]|nr:CotH kinase family protein [Clostridia bacterium]